MISAFFINRPVLANVLAIVMVLLGAVSIFKLPVAQYPEIAPPTVVITASYPGAGAEVTEATVAQVIEDKVIGVDNDFHAVLTVTESDATIPNLPPGTTTEPGTDSAHPNLTYVRELWHAVQTQEISGKDALLLALAQRPLTAQAPALAGPPAPNTPLVPAAPAPGDAPAPVPGDAPLVPLPPA